MEEGIGLFTEIRKKIKDNEVDIRTYSPLTLAYIGDAVYDLAIRSYVVSKGNTSNNRLHKEATGYVSAKAQAKITEVILPLLTEEEAAIYRRGKNSKPSSSAKNATLSEYMKATGFEALIGYLYLKGEDERLVYIINTGIGVINE